MDKTSNQSAPQRAGSGAGRHHRPFVPMTATEAVSMLFIEVGLLILLADYSGLALIAIGIAGYLYARVTYRPPPSAYPGLLAATGPTPPDNEHTAA